MCSSRWVCSRVCRFSRAWRGEIRRATVSAPETPGNCSKSRPADKRVQPDVAQPELHEQEQFGAATAIFGLDGGGQFILPFVAQILFHVVVFFQRRTGGEMFHPRASGFRRVFGAGHPADDNGPAGSFVRAAAREPNFSSHAASAGSSPRWPSLKKFRRRQRDKMVSRIRDGSVESRIRTELAGGSSSVLRKALAAWGFNRSAPRNDGDFVGGFGGLELDFAASIRAFGQR